MRQFLQAGAAPALLAAALTAGVAVARSQDAPAPQPRDAQDAQHDGGLKKVAPVPLKEQDADDPVRRILEEFDGERWTERLTNPDLELREEAFEDLLRRARVDPLARAYLEERSADASNPGLAWTARLALRELGGWGFSAGRALPNRFWMDPRLDQLFDQLMEREPAFPMLAPGTRHFSIIPGTGATESQRGILIEQTPDGAKVTVTEDVDGKESTSEYEGESLEQILEANPELKEKIGDVHVLSVGPNSWSLDLRTPQRDWGGFFSPFRYGDRSEIFDLLEKEPDALDRFFSPTDPSEPVRTDILGVRVMHVSPRQAAELGLDPGTGLLVRSTHPGTLAQILGIRSGDVLLKINGDELKSDEVITSTLRTRKPDEPITLEWVDELGQRQTRTWKP